MTVRPEIENSIA